MKWQKGRQDEVEYFKFKLFSFKICKFGFDGYLLKYPTNTELPKHTDPVEKGKHYRVNITLWGKCIFVCKGKHFYIGEFFHLFRPDLQEHALFTYTKTYKLSLGFAKFD